MSKWRKYLLGTWSWKRPFYSLGSIYILFLILVLFFAELLIFRPPSVGYDAATKDLLMLENAEKQKVATFYLEPREDRPTILWSHGNAEDLERVYPILNELNYAFGYGILAYDYPGYGLSEGNPTEQGAYLNIKASWDYLVNDLGLDQKKIIVLGQSVGSGPSTWLCAQDSISPAGLILLSPFKSINSVPFGYNLFPKDRFQNIDRIRDVDCSLLVVHGKKDKVISYSHGLAVFEAYEGEGIMLTSEESDHNNLWNDDDVIIGISDFITRSLSAP